MRMTIYLNAMEQQAQEVKEIRSHTTHSLLATCDASGLWLFDRRSRMHYRLSWAELSELALQAQQNVPAPLAVRMQTAL